MGDRRLPSARSPYLNSGKRQLLADFALPVAVIVMSFFGSYVFKEIHSEQVIDLLFVGFLLAYSGIGLLVCSFIYSFFLPIPCALFVEYYTQVRRRTAAPMFLSCSTADHSR